jgi:Nuclease-related domain
MTYSKKLLLIGRIKLFGGIFLLLVIAVVCMWWGISRSTNKIPLMTIGGFYTLFGFFLYPLYQKLQKKLDYIGDKILDDISNAKRGVEGETFILSKLNELLDKDKYSIHKNFVIPGRNFDIDVVIVGPKGVIVFEIKNYSTPMVFSGSDAFLQVNHELQPISPDRDPREQIKRHSYNLEKYLNYGGFMGVQSNKAIVFPHEYAAVPEKGTKVGVYLISGIENLKKYLDYLPNNARFTSDFCARLNQYLGTT